MVMMMIPMGRKNLWTRSLFLVVVLLLSLASKQVVVVAVDCSNGDRTTSSSTASTTSTTLNRYDAGTFFQTTSFGLGNNVGFSFFEKQQKSEDDEEDYDDGISSLSLLINSDETGIFNVYTQSLDGIFDADSDVSIATGDGSNMMILKEETRKPLTKSTTDSTFGISYFPRGDHRVVFSRDEGGNELSHVYVRSTDGLSVIDLTPAESTTHENTRAIFAGWYKDNTSFMIVSNEREEQYFDIYEYNFVGLVDGGDDETYESYMESRTMIYENHLGYSIEAISTSGRWVVMKESSTSSNNDLYLVDLEEGGGYAPLHISQHDGNVYHTIHGFTVDESALIYGTDEYGEYTQAWTYNMESGKKELFAKDENWDVVYVTQSFTGRYVVVGTNVDGQLIMNITDTTKNNELLQLPNELPSGEIHNIRFSQNEQYMAFSINSDISPNDIYVMNLDTQQVVKVTNSLSTSNICQNDLVESQVVRYSSFDDMLIPSIQYKPHDASPDNKVPALVYVHGGPGGQSTKGFSPTIQHLVNHGYAVLAPNNRGSSGYGKTFFHLDDKQHGEGDLQDIVYGKKYLESLDWVDSTKIGIIGGSYGGYMVVAALAFHPEVFDVGINMFGVTNWLRVLEDIPAWWEAERQELYDELGDPALEEERLRQISPLFHADQITKPLLVVQGANDPRVPQVESDELVQALKYNGVPVQYLLFDDEGHGFYKKENRIEASEAYLSFLNKYLVNPVSWRAGGSYDDQPNSFITDSESDDSSAITTTLKLWRLITPITTIVITTVFQFMFV